MRTVARCDAAAGAAISETSRAAETTAPTSDRERPANGALEPLKDARWAPLARPSKTRASSLPAAARRRRPRWTGRTAEGLGRVGGVWRRLHERGGQGRGRGGAGGGTRGGGGGR